MQNEKQTIYRQVHTCSACGAVDMFRSSGGKKPVTDGIFVAYARCRRCGANVKIVYEVKKHAKN